MLEVRVEFFGLARLRAGSRSSHSKPIPCGLFSIARESPELKRPNREGFPGFAWRVAIRCEKRGFRGTPLLMWKQNRANLEEPLLYGVSLLVLGADAGGGAGLMKAL
jgi:hypothetical protein